MQILNKLREKLTMKNLCFCFALFCTANVYGQVQSENNSLAELFYEKSFSGTKDSYLLKEISSNDIDILIPSPNFVIATTNDKGVINEIRGDSI